jgi:hypothetical protein
LFSCFLVLFIPSPSRGGKVRMGVERVIRPDLARVLTHYPVQRLASFARECVRCADVQRLLAVAPPCAWVTSLCGGQREVTKRKAAPDCATSPEPHVALGPARSHAASCRGSLPHASLHAALRASSQSHAGPGRSIRGLTSTTEPQKQKRSTDFGSTLLRLAVFGLAATLIERGFGVAHDGPG